MGAPLVALLALVIAPSAQAAARCSTSTAQRYFQVRASGTTCRTAVIVADSFTEDGGPNALDQHSRRWRCRVVFASPGSDTPRPFSRVQCKRGPRVVGFMLRS
jgi:hypothetical protein